VNFGLRFLGDIAETGAGFQRLASLAEQSGFDSCWFAHDPFQRSSWTNSVSVALATTRIKVGYNVKPYTINPSEIATFAAGLDEISKGRAIIGIGSHTETMYEWLGLSGVSLADLTQEAVALVRGLLEGRKMQFSGKIFHWNKECYLRFSPLRKRVPIYIPGVGREMFELSGRIGDGSLPMATPPESFDYPMSYIKKGADGAGRKISDVDRVALVWMYVSEEGDVDKMALKRVISYFLPYLEMEMVGRLGITESEVQRVQKELVKGRYEAAAEMVDDKLLDLAIYGTPQECSRRFEELLKRGATSISIGGPLGSEPAEAIKLIGRRIIGGFGKQSSR